MITKIQEFFSFNLIFKFCIKFFFVNFDLDWHAPTKSKSLYHPTCKSHDQFLSTKLVGQSDQFAINTYKVQ
jgi:hypothetical protein